MAPAVPKSDASRGLQRALDATASDFRLTGALAETSATLGEAILHALRLARLFHPSAQISLHVSGDRACVAIEPGCDPLTPETAEFMLTAGVLGARALTGQDLVPFEVCFAHDAPPDRAQHERVLRCNVRFGAARCACYFDTRWLLEPVLHADAARARTLRHKAEHRLEHGTGAARFIERARAALEIEIHEGSPTCERVAERLDLHPKAFIRRLHAAGLGYRELLERVRFGMAELEMVRSDVRVSAIAERLGYADKSAFHRAFKRWAGCSPSEYRRQHRLAG